MSWVVQEEQVVTANKSYPTAPASDFPKLSRKITI
jgi:hypothetical protein